MGDGWVRFTQTAGGRTGFPAPRAVRRPPFVQYFVADRLVDVGAHPLRRRPQREPPRRGLDVPSPLGVRRPTGLLVAKSGLVDYKDWAGNAFGKHTPWGDEDSPAFVSAVETALERQLSAVMMHGAAKPEIRKLKAGRDADGAGCARRRAVPAARRGARGRGRRERSGGGGSGRRCSASGRCSRVARGRPGCVPAPPVASRPMPFDSVDRDLLVALSGGHRREEELGRS